MTVSRSLLIAVALMMTAAACSSDSAPATTDASVSTTDPAPITTSPSPTTSAGSLPTATTSGATTTILPGEPFDLFVPQDGEMVSVVGVAHDDVLNIREGPGVSYAIVGTLAPTADDVAGTGVGRILESSIWWKVVALGTEGWVNASFVSRTGDVVDLTSIVVDGLGEIPAAETMMELGLIVATELASVDPASDIVMSVAPSAGDVGEVTYDILGFGDDSFAGYRLHIFGQSIEGEFSLMAVEATELCTRGTTAEGLCA